MNIKELADIGAKAAYACSIKTKKSNPTELTIDSDSYIYDAKAIVRESFTQAVIDAYEKDKAMSTDKWAKEKEAYANGLKIEHKWNDKRSWYPCLYPMWYDHFEYRIAPAQETNVAEPSEIDRLKAELAAAREHIADLEKILKINKTREEFEQWFNATECYPIEDLGGKRSKNIAWDAWKAAKTSV